MKIKGKIQLILDVILTIILLTLYSKRFLGMVYHEVAGLAVLLPVAIHIIINLKTVYGMCKNFIRVPLHIKICLLVDGLLLLTFVFMGVSGILISRTIFTGISTTNMFVKMYHMCIGGLSVILLGIHIGLHICRREMPGKIAVALTIVILACGIYGVSSSGMVRWISMPFAVQGAFRQEGGDIPTMKLANEHGIASKQTEGGAQDADGQEKFAEGQEQNSIEGAKHGEGEQGNRYGKGIGKGNGERPGKGQGYDPGKGRGSGAGIENGFGMGPGNRQMSPVRQITTLIQFFGMMFACAMATYWIVIWKKKL